MICEYEMKDPASWSEYVSLGGYEALKKAVADPESVIPEIKNAGLRGRSGSGFPTGDKWDMTKAAESETRYIVCNADEGEPGVFKDRYAILRNPHDLIEGIAICGIAVGSAKGFIYLRGEYSDVKKVLEKAIREAYENNCLGEDILDSGRSFDLELVMGHGSYVCGEETALLESIEGKRGEPRFKPPYPSVVGLWGEPTVINNAETMMNVPVIIRNGAEKYREDGTERSSGTKLYSVCGDVCRPGVYELPLGTTLRELFELAGECPGGKKLKGAQTGGASGSIVTPDVLDEHFDYELKNAVFGTGCVTFFAEGTDLLDVCIEDIRFFTKQSCGKCTPCRLGSQMILKILLKIKDGHGVPEDLDELKEIGAYMKENSMCGLGQAAATPVLTALENFPDEFVSDAMPQRSTMGKDGELVWIESY